MVICSEKLITDERTFLVFESCLKNMLKYCPSCGHFIDQILTTEVQNVGSQYKIKIQCFNGCDTTWASQPEFLLHEVLEIG